MMIHMRFAVLADIHGILPALDAVLDELSQEDLDGVIVAGDLVGGPHSTEVVDRLRAYQCWMIRGNWENYVLRFASGNAPDWWLSRKQFAFVRWNYENIDGAMIDFLKSLPEQRCLEFPGADAIRVVHGSPSDVSELIFPEEDISKLDRALEQVYEPVVIFAHSHQAWVIERNGRLAVNPGSLGMSFDGEQCGTYAILTWENQRWSAEIRKLHYDFKQLRQAYIETGLLEKGGAFSRCCLVSIERGVNYLPPLLDYAYKKAEEAGYAGCPFVPDEIWDEATRSFEQLNYQGAP